LDGLSFDPLTFFDGEGCSAEVGIGRGAVFKAFMEALMVIVLDEGLDFGYRALKWQLTDHQSTYPPISKREEFRALLGVRKYPKNESLVLNWMLWGFR
jgi:hypothetical protein